LSRPVLDLVLSPIFKISIQVVVYGFSYSFYCVEVIFSVYFVCFGFLSIFIFSVYFLVFILFSFVASLLIGVLLVVSISLLASQSSYDMVDIYIRGKSKA
jgi:hypothetical protein